MKRNLIAFVIAIVFGLSMVVGCSTIQKPVTPPGCELSLVYKYVPYPQLSGGIATIVGLEAYKAAVNAGMDTAPYIKAMESMSIALDNPSLTYTGFVKALAFTNDNVMKYAGIEIVFMASLLEQMATQNAVMNECDRNYFAKQIDDLVMLIKLVK